LIKRDVFCNRGEEIFYIFCWIFEGEEVEETAVLRRNNLVLINGGGDGRLY
jgi:hypothetical protein